MKHAYQNILLTYSFSWHNHRYLLPSSVGHSVVPKPQTHFTFQSSCSPTYIYNGMSYTTTTYLFMLAFVSFNLMAARSEPLIVDGLSFASCCLVIIRSELTLKSNIDGCPLQLLCRHLSTIFHEQHPSSLGLPIYSYNRIIYIVQILGLVIRLNAWMHVTS